MGGVLWNSASGAFSYTVGSGKKRLDEVTVAIRVEKGSQLVALWHTHGAPHRTRAYFSDVDTDLVEAMGLPLYLADPGGNLRVFRPGDRRLSALRSERLGLGRRVGYAKGALVARALNRPTQHAC